ncbi:MAG: hypothetical protein QG653_350 [Patescibacteria group bacterium]|nr:hypothetical protein [Patescibacteria group bacterium]
MIYAIVGTNKEKREKAQEKVSVLGIPTAHLYSEQIAGLRPLVDATNLFGEKVIVMLSQTFEVASSREEVTDLLGKMQDSENIFIIDEPFADANRVKKLVKFSEKLFDCREEGVGEASPFPMCNAFGKRDKKQAFIEWMKIKDVSEPVEMIHGALWWKMKTIWEDTLNGKPTKFTKEECEYFGGKIMRATMESYRGNGNLKDKLEEIVLEV